MKILFVASESVPFIKTGGLADVAYALPKALRKLGLDVRVILPKYGDIPQSFKEKMKPIGELSVPVGWRNQYGGLEYLEEDGIPFYFIDNEYYFKRAGAYKFYDDGERFAFFSRAVLEAIDCMEDFSPDILHCNDWHTGVIPVLLKEHYHSSPKHSNIKTMFTIHNLQYQGVFGHNVLGELLSLGEEYYSEDKLKYHDAISFMKGGINYSDLITTVSNTYAQEIRTPFYGEGLHGLLENHSHHLHGIVNGIDYDLFNPQTDPSIVSNYDLATIKEKAKNKIALQEQLNLTVDENIPMIGLITRLVKQKGLDLISHILHDLLKLNVQLVVLGNGDEEYENLFKYQAWMNYNKFSCKIGFDNEFAKKIYAASDMFLMPSLFEPCGIGQLLAMRYGSVPIVRETGGLKDTVAPYNEYTGEGNGFSFANYNAHDMLYTIERATNLYQNKKVWDSIVQSGMKCDNSWNSSAQKYIELYKSLL